MLLSTMSYEQIYREIKKDFRDVKAYYDDALKEKVFKEAKRSLRYPFRKLDTYTHPKSQNKYSYLSIVKKRSHRNKLEVTVFCEYEAQWGKEIITIAFKKDILTQQNKLFLSIFQAHFFKRYYERFIHDEQSERDKIAIFLIRNAGALRLGSNVVSDNERAKDDPDYIDTGLLNLDGLCLGKVCNENRNIYIYKTFIALNELHQNQLEKVMHEYIRMVAEQGCRDNPQCSKSINEFYTNAIKQFKEILLGDNQMTDEERIRKYLEEYNKACKALSKYIII